MSSKDKTALVTGASRGIGKAIALALGSAGFTVVGTATSDKGAENISAYLDQAQVKGAGMALDVTQADAVETVLGSIQEQFGAPLVVVNNAGITRDNLMLRMKEEEWDAVIATNLSAIFRLTKACLKPMMKARWGRVINISSVVGSTGNAGQVNYASAKAGLIGFSKSLAQELGSRGITVNVVAPGFIDTDMTKDLPETQREQLLNQIPLSRLGAPEDIAHAVAFLASEQAGYITGETLHVNGGMYMS